MYLTNWTEIDGAYFECIGSIKEDLTPILRLRAVKMIDGYYEAVVRDFKSGRMLSSRCGKTNHEYDLDRAKMKTIELAQLVLIYEGSFECIQINKYICPHPTISGKHCSECQILDSIIRKEPKCECSLCNNTFDKCTCVCDVDEYAVIDSMEHLRPLSDEEKYEKVYDQETGGEDEERERYE